MRALLLLWVVLLTVIQGNAEQATSERAIAFNRDMRPLLSDNCFHCHGPDASHREADLRLDEREAAIEFGAITPGDAHASWSSSEFMPKTPTLSCHRWNQVRD